MHETSAQDSVDPLEPPSEFGALFNTLQGQIDDLFDDMPFGSHTVGWTALFNESTTPNWVGFAPRAKP